MDAPKANETTLTYAVRDPGYWATATVPMTKEGYRRLAEALQRNVALSIATVDEAHFQRFMRDWVSAVGIFEKAGCLTREEASDEISRIRGYPREAVSYAVDKILAGIEAIRSPAGEPFSWRRLVGALMSGRGGP